MRRHARRLSFAAALLVACGDLATGAADGPSPASEASDPSKKPPLPSATLELGVEQALVHAISPPTAADDMYRVDAFVAAMIFERLRQSGGAGEFVHETTDDDPNVVGYRVLAATGGSIWARLGLQTGDVVEAIGGVSLTGVDRVRFALEGAENRVTLMIHRDGVSFTHGYMMEGGKAWRAILAGDSGDADDAGSDTDGPVVVADPEAHGEGPTAAADPSVRSQAERPSATPRPRAPRPRPQEPRPSTTPKPAGPVASDVTCSSKSRCTISKRHFDSLVAAPERMQSQIDVVPAIRNDVFSGYRIKSVRPRSTAAGLGFRAGDKITHINGYDLTNDVAAMQLYLSLGATRVFKIRYERDGRNQLKTVTVA